MPLLTPSYMPPWWLKNGHSATLHANLFRKKIDFIFDTHVEIHTPDHDFLDVFIKTNHANKLVIITHGLEGNAHRHYMKGMAKKFYEEGFDVIAWNLRGCGERINLAPATYHSSKIEDLACIINFALQRGYKDIALVGFSLGANLTLKYLGDEKRASLVRSGVAISVPCHLPSACQVLENSFFGIYRKHFLLKLHRKAKLKTEQYPHITPFRKLNTLYDFDNYFTAKWNGFRDAMDYYETSSSLYVLEKINVPTLILNALDDPFLSPQCFPTILAQQSPFIFLEATEYGGHVGFEQMNTQETYSEKRAFEFCISTF